MKSDKTLEYVKDNFKAKYKQKRYPKKKDQKNPNPNLWVLEIDSVKFEEEEAPNEIMEYDEEDIA
jgi:hypothetical protein